MSSKAEEGREAIAEEYELERRGGEIECEPCVETTEVPLDDGDARGNQETECVEQG